MPGNIAGINYPLNGLELNLPIDSDYLGRLAVLLTQLTGMNMIKAYQAATLHIGFQKVHSYGHSSVRLS